MLRSAQEYLEELFGEFIDPDQVRMAGTVLATIILAAANVTAFGWGLGLLMSLALVTSVMLGYSYQFLWSSMIATMLKALHAPLAGMVAASTSDLRVQQVLHAVHAIDWWKLVLCVYLFAILCATLFQAASSMQSRPQLQED